jgi:hypothetical protein
MLRVPARKWRDGLYPFSPHKPIPKAADLFCTRKCALGRISAGKERKSTVAIPAQRPCSPYHRTGATALLSTNSAEPRCPAPLWLPHVSHRSGRRCGGESWEECPSAFLEPSVADSSPSSGPRCAVSAPAGAASGARGYPCSAHALRDF